MYTFMFHRAPPGGACALRLVGASGAALGDLALDWRDSLSVSTLCVTERGAAGWLWAQRSRALEQFALLGLRLELELLVRLVLELVVFVVQMPRVLCAKAQAQGLELLVLRRLGLPQTLQQLLLDLWQKQQCTVVFITHDIEEALRLGDRIIVLDTRPATVAADIRITEPRPRSPHWFRSTEGDRIARQIRAILRGGGAH